MAFAEREKAVAITDADRKLVYVNDAFLHMVGYKLSEVIGKKPSFLQGELTTTDSVEYTRKKLSECVPFEVDIVNYRKNGEAYICHVEIEPLFLNGKLTHFIAYEEDIDTIAKVMVNEEDLNRINKVRDYFTSTTNYTNPYLQASDVAAANGMQTRCVGRVLRIFENKSFNEYLNEFRIKQALIFLNDNEVNQYTLQHISKLCGFNSKSVFNSAFKLHTGVTPSEYLRRSLKMEDRLHLN
jgi:PAS domain S-box-containing protein